MVDTVDACSERALALACARALSTELSDSAVGRAHETMIDTGRIKVDSRDRCPSWFDVQRLRALALTSAGVWRVESLSSLRNQ